MKNWVLLATFIFSIPALADDSICPWGLDNNATITSLKKIKVDVEFSCPAKINDPANAMQAGKIRDFYAESLNAFSKESTLLEELTKRDFIRVLRFSPQTIHAPDYDPNARILTFGLYSNDAYTFGNKVAKREDSILLLKNLVSAWNSLFKGRAVLPETSTMTWGDQTRHKEMVDSLTKVKADVDKSLALLKSFDSMIKVVQLGNGTLFSNGYLSLDSAAFASSGQLNDVLNVMKVYSKIPAAVSSKFAISCGLGCKQDAFLYTMALSDIFDKIGNRWDQIAKASPKVRTIVFNLGANFPVGAFNYDSDRKSVSMPVGFSGIFSEEIFVQSLEQLSKL